MSDKTAVGTPTPLFVAARRWGWKHVDGPYTIDVGISGDMMLSKDVGAKFQTVSFGVSEDIDVHVDLGTITKVMFSTSAYPELTDNQVFAISDILVDKSSNTLTVVGNILERLED